MHGDLGRKLLHKKQYQYNRVHAQDLTATFPPFGDRRHKEAKNCTEKQYKRLHNWLLAQALTATFLPWKTLPLSDKRETRHPAPRAGFDSHFSSLGKSYSYQISTGLPDPMQAGNAVGPHAGICVTPCSHLCDPMQAGIAVGPMQAGTAELGM